MRNPMDGHRDIYPWPYEWSRDLAGHVVSMMAVVDLIYEDLDKWTYENHWQYFQGDVEVPSSHVVDIYWTDDGVERCQLPPAIGDHVAEILIAEHADKIRRLIWFGRIWHPGEGWRVYEGIQGDFVDHIHVEVEPE